MDIIVGRYSGYCSGVRQSVLKAERVLREKRRLYCLGEIVHNPQTVRGLEKKGLRSVESLGVVPAGVDFIVRSHGLPADIWKRLNGKRLAVSDGTCSRVRKIHRIVRDAISRKSPVVIIGKASHPEVRAIASLAKRNIFVVEERADVERLPGLESVSVVVQTTFNPDSFCALLSALVLRCKILHVFNTLCEETRWRQEEVRRLARECGLVVVVGGKNSSNTKTLVELASASSRVHHVSGSEELKPGWFRGVRRAAVVSGASTPAADVERVVARIREIAAKRN